MSIKFEYDRDIAHNAVLYVLNKYNGKLDKLKLIKLTFYTDCLSIERQFRPVFGGVYRAMKHGPVALNLLDDIESGRFNEGFSLVLYDVVASKPPNLDYLAKSDIKIIDEILSKYGQTDKYDLRDETHKLKSWLKNYKEDSNSFVIPYEDFFLDFPDNERAREILEIIKDRQEAWGFLK